MASVRDIFIYEFSPALYIHIVLLLNDIVDCSEQLNSWRNALLIANQIYPLNSKVHYKRSPSTHAINEPCSTKPPMKFSSNAKSQPSPSRHVTGPLLYLPTTIGSS